MHPDCDFCKAEYFHRRAGQVFADLPVVPEMSHYFPLALIGQSGGRHSLSIEGAPA
jgi:hypothetical protein